MSTKECVCDARYASGTAAWRVTNAFYEQLLPLVVAEWRTEPEQNLVAVTFRNGCDFVGATSARRMHGPGTLRCPNGTIYTGNFQHNRLSTAHGTLTFADHSVYAGAIHLGQRHGHGEHRQFNGHWTKDRRAHGRQVYTNGVYDGAYDEHGHRSKGTYRFSNGDVYAGQWARGGFAGVGVYEWCGVATFSGVWAESRQHGVGVLAFGDGGSCEIYTIWLAGRKHGAGLIVAPNASVYGSECLYRNDDFQGAEHLWLTDTVLDAIATLRRTHADIVPNSDDARAFVSLVARLCRDDKTEEPPLKWSPVDMPAHKIDLRDTPIVDFVEGLLPATGMKRAELASRELKSVRQAIEATLGLLHAVYDKYATFGWPQLDGGRQQMTRLALWQLYRDMGAHQLGLNVADLTADARRQFKILAAAGSRPLEAVPFAHFLKYLLHFTLVLATENPVFRVACHEEHTPLFGLFATAFLITVRTFLVPLQPFACGRLPPLLADNDFTLAAQRVFTRLFAYLGDSDTIRSVFRFVCIIKRTAKLGSDEYDNGAGSEHTSINLLEHISDADFIDSTAVMFPSHKSETGVSAAVSTLNATCLEACELFLSIVERNIQIQKQIAAAGEPAATMAVAMVASDNTITANTTRLSGANALPVNNKRQRKSKRTAPNK